MLGFGGFEKALCGGAKSECSASSAAAELSPAKLGQNPPEYQVGIGTTDEEKPVIYERSEEPTPSDAVDTSSIKRGIEVSMGDATLQITSVKLDGPSTYFVWSRTVEISVGARGLQGYLTREKLRPADGDPTRRQWESENSLVVLWLINSMTPAVIRRFRFFGTAYEIWEETERIYSQKINNFYIYNLSCKIHGMRQGEMSALTYYLELMSLWAEMDFYRPTGDAVSFEKCREEERIFRFLHGLSPKFDRIVVKILTRRELPSLEEVCSIVRSEETLQRIVNGRVNDPKPEAAGVARPRRREDRRHLRCDHCHKIGHARESCWKLHGRPLYR